MKYIKKSAFALLGVDCGLYKFLKRGAGLWECYCKETIQGILIHITFLNLHLFPSPAIGWVLSFITFWTRHCKDQTSSQSSINFPEQILQYSQHICIAGIKGVVRGGGVGVLGVCAYVEGTREWAAQLTHKFPNMWIIHASSTSFSHIFHSKYRQIYKHTHAHLWYKSGPGPRCECNFLLFSGSLKRSSVNGLRGPPGKGILAHHVLNLITH